MADEVVTVVKIDATAAESEFKNLGDTGAEAMRKVEDAAAPANKELAKVEEAAYRFGSSLRDVGQAAGELGRQIPAVIGALGKLAALATGAMLAAAKAAANATDAIRDSAIAAGTAADAYQKLAFAAGQAGANTQKLDRAFAVLNAGGAALEGKLAKLGVRLKTGSGQARDAGEVFSEVAEKISQIEDPAQRAGAAAEVFGRRVGPGLVELLSEGQAGLKKLGDEAQRLGLVFTKAELKVGDEFNDALTKLMQTLGALGTRIGLTFGPAFTQVFDAITESVVVLTPYVLKLADVFAKVLGPSVKFITDALGPTGLGFGAAAVAIGVLVGSVGLLGRLLAPIGGLATAALAPFKVLGTAAVAVFKLMTTSMISVVALVRVLAVAFGVLAGPIGIIGAAIGILIIAFGDSSQEARSWQDIMTGIFKTVMDAAKLFADTFGPLLRDAFAGLGILYREVLVPAFQGIKKGFDELAKWINDTFGTKLTGTQLFGAAILALAVAFGGLPAAITAVTVAFGLLITKFKENKELMIGIGILIAALVILFGSIQFVILAIVLAVGYLIAKWPELKKASEETVASLKKEWEAWVTWFEGTWMGKTIAAIQKVIDWFKKLGDASAEASKTQEVQGGGGGGGGGHKRGGPIRGPGTTTSDSVPLWGSRGEWVIQAKAVQHYGRSFMAALNSMRLPRGGLDMASLAGALVVAPPRTHFATGGEVGGARSSRVLNLTLPGLGSFPGLTGPDETMDRLQVAAIRSQLRSAGRLPGWYGGR